MNYRERREKVYSQMEDKSILLLYSGEAPHISADAYHHFEANRQFFYLTGIRRENMVLLMEKCGDKLEETLFIEPVVPEIERWVGRKMTVEEAKEVSSVENVVMIDTLDSTLNRVLTRKLPKKVYFDTYRHQKSDLPDYNLAKARPTWR